VRTTTTIVAAVIVISLTTAFLARHEKHRPICVAGGVENLMTDCRWH